MDENLSVRKPTSLKTLRALLALAERYGLSELHCNGVYLRRGGPVKNDTPKAKESKQKQETPVDDDDYEARLSKEVSDEIKLHEAALKDEV